MNQKKYKVILITIFSFLLLNATCGEEKPKNNSFIGALFLSLSGGIGGGSSTPVATYSIGGTITGLTRSGLVLENNLSESLTISSSASSFAFLTKTSDFSVTVKTQPSAQRCTVAKGSGIAVADFTEVTVVCAFDYTSWSQRNSSLPSSQLWKLGFGNGTFVAIGSFSAAAATSLDGITWTSRTLPSSQNWTSLAYGNGTFVAISANTSNVSATSSDGVTWTARTMPSAQSWATIAFGNGVFVVLAAGSTVAATSADGITWTTRALPVLENWTAVTFGNNVFVAIVSSANSVRAATSPDGITWTQRSLSNAGTNGYTSITFGNAIFVAVSAATLGSGTTTFASTSPDGITWTARTLPLSDNWISIAFGNGTFAIIPNSIAGRSALRSTDGITWTANPIPTAAWRNVAFGNNIFVAVSDNNTSPSTTTMTSP